MCVPIISKLISTTVPPYGRLNNRPTHQTRATVYRLGSNFIISFFTRAAPTHQGSTAKATIDRISNVYRERARTGGGKLANSGGTNKGNYQAGGGELPNVATVARFAIERERLAREMGVDELGGPATLGVVNIGAAAAAAHGQQRNNHNLKGQGGVSGNKRVKNSRRGAGRGAAIDRSSGGGRGTEIGENFSENDVTLFASGAEAVTERRSAGEMLLEKLESVAEARSIESAGGLRGDGDRTEIDHAPHGNWQTDEEPPFIHDPVGEREGRTGAGELSITESAFLERSRRRGSLDGDEDGVGRGGDGGDSLFGHHFEAGFRDESSVTDDRGGGGGGGGGGGHIATIGALRDRLSTVEGENAALRARARRAEEERAAEAARGDRASKKLAQVCIGSQRAWVCR